MVGRDGGPGFLDRQRGDTVAGANGNSRSAPSPPLVIIPLPLLPPARTSGMDAITHEAVTTPTPLALFLPCP